MAEVRTNRFETVLPATAASPGVARRFVAAALRRVATDATVVESAQLLVSELVTNAVVHAGSEVRLTVIVRGAALRIEVGDHGLDRPELRPPGVDALDGRGLGIVDGVASAWGADDRPNGKVVWFELDC